MSALAGSVTLVIPPGGLPAGVSADDIVIRDASDDAPFVPVDGGPNLLALSLEPSGLAFSAPALLTVDIASPPDGAFMFAYLASGENFEPVLLSDAQFNEETGRVQVSAVLPHFSDFVINIDRLDPLLTVNFTATATVEDRNLGLVSGTFPVNLPVTSRVDGEQTWEARTTTTQLVTNSGPWDVSANFEPDDDSRAILSPSLRAAFTEDGTPALSGSTRTLTLRTTFTCKQAGDFRIRVRGGGPWGGGWVQQDFVTRSTTDGRIVASAFRSASGVARLSANVTGECAAPEPVAPCCSMAVNLARSYSASFANGRGSCAGFPSTFSDPTYRLLLQVPADPDADPRALQGTLTQESSGQVVEGSWNADTGAWTFTFATPGGAEEPLERFQAGTTDPDGTLRALYDHRATSGQGRCE